MSRRAVLAGVVMSAVCVMPSVATAQNPAPAVTLATQQAQLDVTLTRYQGDKKLSTLPFTLMLSAAQRSQPTSMRMGVDVPIGTSTSNVTQTTGAQGGSPRAVETAKVETTYRNIGTDISCWATRIDDTNYSVSVTISDSSLAPPDSSRPATAGGPGSFRTFQTSNTLQMKDGQTRLFGVASDKTTGETLRIEVTLAIVK